VSRAAAGNVACSWRTNPLLISVRWGRAALQRAVIVYSSSYSTLVTRVKLSCRTALLVP